MPENTLEFIITAQNEAKQAFNEIKSQLTEVKDKSTELAGVTTSSQKEMAQSVFTGVAAWDMLKQGVTMAVNFAKGSIDEYLEGVEKVNLAKANIEAAGLSWETVGGQVEEFGSKMMQFGVDNDDAVLSAAKLTKAVGGDLSKGLELATLAADLTASGFGDLESNTSNLSAILAGKGSMAARTYRLNLSDTATTGEILDAVQGKVTQTAEKFGDRVPGKIKAVKEGYDELKQMVGEGIVAGFDNATGAFEKSDQGMKQMKETGIALKVAFFELMNIGGVLVSSMQLLAAVLSNTAYQAMAAWDAFHGDFNQAKADLEAGTENIKDKFNILKDSIIALNDPIGKLNAYEKENALASKTAANGMKDLGEGITNAENIVNKFQEAVKSTNNQLKQMAREFTQSQADINQQGKDETVNYFAGLIAENEAAGIKIDEIEEKILKLKKQRAQDKSKAEKASIDEQINDLRIESENIKEELAIRETEQSKYRDVRKQYATEITDRVKYLSADEYTQIQMDTSRKLLENKKEYLQKQINLLLELKDKKEAADQEIQIEKEKAAEIKISLKGITSAVDEACDKQFSSIKKLADRAISEYKRMQRAASSYSSGSSGMSSAYSSSSVDDAIIAPGGKVITTDPEDYLIATKTPGRLLSAFGQQSGLQPATINVYVQGGYYLDERAKREFGEYLASSLKRTMKL